MGHQSKAQIGAWLDQEDRRVSEIIRQCGWFIQAVNGEARQAPFAYTVGLFGLGHPELVVFGLDAYSAGHVLNWFGEQVRAGNDLTSGQMVEPPGAQMRFLVEELPRPGRVLLSANRHYRRPPKASVPAHQLTWDVEGKFPWDAGYPYEAWMQPRPGEFAA